MKPTKGGGVAPITAHNMAEKDSGTMRVPAKVITAKWTPKLGSSNEHLGMIALDDDFLLRFPILQSSDNIPCGTTMLWGIADDLRKCTAITLPCPPPGSARGQGEQSFSLEVPVNRLLIGHQHIADPTSDFVTELILTPWPNKDLHVQQLYDFIQPATDIDEIKFSQRCALNRQLFASALSAYFMPEHKVLFAIPVGMLGATIAAWIGGNESFGHGFAYQTRIMFSLRFDSPRDLTTAMDEALQLCTLLSFVAHQYIYPTDLRVRVKGDNGPPYELHHYGLPNAVAQPHTWVRNTLVLPDQQPDLFRQLIQQWYATNNQFLPSRYLYRQTLQKPFLYSAERFLTIFRALEARINMAGYQLLTSEELQAAEDALRTALATSPRLEPLIRKLRSTNTQSPKQVLKQELPKVLATANITPMFNMDQFVERIYERRNKTAHGGPHFEEPSPDALLNDTRLLTTFYVLIESRDLGLYVQEAFLKFRSALDYFQLPLTISVPAAIE
jgi:hypothetical protein